MYWNAFQPNSSMDIRSRELGKNLLNFRRGAITASNATMLGQEASQDWDRRVRDRIQKLTPTEIGYQRISQILINGKVQKLIEHETILEVQLTQAIAPKTSIKMNLQFEAQVPVQIRRSGRDNAQGIRYSMSQWYPKMVEYDYQGWNANAYIAREFHGVWGNYDVKITVDKNYTLGASGYLQNKNEIGHGYQDEGIEVKTAKKTKTLTWHFVAPMVHDFAWGADDNFLHDKIIGENGVELHFLYKNDKEYVENWKAMQPKTAELLSFFNKNIGIYPYKQYSVIQGGDGGMEYAMCTLITGKRSVGSLVGVTAHEMAHSWFQHVLATNESKHEWMDEGFTSFISDLAMTEIMPSKNKKDDENPFLSSYNNYFYMVTSGKEQPQSTHADRYDENMVYGISSYSKGTVFLTQLGYVIGIENMMKTLKRFYYDYQFTHPTPNDFKRTAERVSGAVLDWYLVDWTQTTNTIDYGIKNIDDNGKITLERIGRMPMPLDILVAYEDGTVESFYIPNPLTRWEKENPYPQIKRTVLKGWDWAYPTFEFSLSQEKSKIKSVAIDPSGLMADVNKENNLFEKK
jgi:hypothetical protein